MFRFVKVLVALGLALAIFAGGPGSVAVAEDIVEVHWHCDFECWPSIHYNPPVGQPRHICPFGC